MIRYELNVQREAQALIVMQHSTAVVNNKYKSDDRMHKSKAYWLLTIDWC